MTIIATRYNLIEIKHGIVIHGCNAQGIMGAGIALQIRQKYPQAYSEYIEECNKYSNKELLLGKVVLAKIKESLYIANCITQLFYGRNKYRIYCSYEAIKECFIKINLLAIEKQLPIYFPKIGCGLANGDWNIVREIINTTIDNSVEKILCLNTPENVNSD